MISNSESLQFLRFLISVELLVKCCGFKGKGADETLSTLELSTLYLRLTTPLRYLQFETLKGTASVLCCSSSDALLVHSVVKNK